MGILSEILVLPAGDFEVQETFDFLVVKGLRKAPATLELKTLLKSMWQQKASVDSIPFVVRVSLTRGADTEVISIHSDGTPSYPRKAFGDDLFDCPECKRFIGALKTISVEKDGVRAYKSAVEFFDHLGQCGY